VSNSQEVLQKSIKITLGLEPEPDSANNTPLVLLGLLSLLAAVELADVFRWSRLLQSSHTRRGDGLAVWSALACTSDYR
jgi:hypothetical protein